MHSTNENQDFSPNFPLTASAQQKEMKNQSYFNSKDENWVDAKEEDFFLTPKPLRKRANRPYKSVREDVFRLKIQNICDKYFINYFKKDLDRIIGKVQKMNEYEHINKYTTQSAAVVIVCEYQDQIRIKSTNQFCSCNGLSTFAFNKKYRIYYQLFVKDQLKQQYDLNPEETLYKEVEVRGKLRRVKKYAEISNPTEAINVIYDMLFKKMYFQDNRRQIIERVLMYYQELSSHVHLEWITATVERTYYIIFFILKALKVSLFFKDYQLAVLTRTAVELNEPDKNQAFRILHQYIEEKSSTLLRANIYDRNPEESF